MAILAFQKPDKVVQLELTNTFGKFEFRPLEPGFGTTVGNALRRILLSSLEGFAINTIKIEGVEHEFATIPGVKEDVTNIILNLKQVRFKQEVPSTQEEKAVVIITGSRTFKAGDISKQLTGFSVLNPDMVICNLAPKATLHIEITINKGRGYVPSEENREFCSDVYQLPVDSIYTPILNVKYAVENYRVEQKTDYERLVVEITTDGSIAPNKALTEAADILIYHFQLFSDDNIKKDLVQSIDLKNNGDDFRNRRQLLKTALSDMELSVRALNCLKSANVYTVGDLVGTTRKELMKFRNFGKKSLDELEQLLETIGFEFGTDLTQYKLDKD